MTKRKQTPTQQDKTATAQEAPPPKTLPEFLETIPDCRRGQGRMHRLSTILLLILMATMSGCFGQRPTGDFIQKHRKERGEALKPKNDKLPSRQTISRVMQQLDYEQFTGVFYAWAKTVLSIEDKDGMSLDGKGISGTLQAAGTAQQQYTNLVSVFAQKTGQVLLQGKVGNKTNEIPLVVQLVKKLGLRDLVLTADALHAQKQTVKAIGESDNDYVIGVKGNQKKLQARLKKTANTQSLSGAT
jgi:hypothetical protein